MGLRILGAGLPRTGTNSLKLAIERLTGEPCYHMFEMAERQDEHIPLWFRMLDGDLEARHEIFAGFGSAIDWPTSILWRELAELYPDALVVLSRRESADAWWRSADRTVWRSMRLRAGQGPFGELNRRLTARFHSNLDDAEGAKAAYQRHLAEVRDTIDGGRLVELEPADGWGPLCDALGVPVPDEPYPHLNTSAEFGSRMGWD